MLTQARVLKPDKNRFKAGERYVTAILDGVNTGIKKNFRCNECGSILFQYYDSLNMLFEGKLLESSHPIDIMCVKGGCKTIYRINQL